MSRIYPSLWLEMGEWEGYGSNFFDPRNPIFKFITVEEPSETIKKSIMMY
jgi:hypothetical protein